MAKKSNLASMSVDALLKMRDDIGVIISRKADQLKKELASLGADYAEVGRIALYGKKKASRKGSKVAAKYRNPKTGETYAGRGAMAGWLKAELKAGKKLEDFLVAKAAAPMKKAAKKKRKAKR